MMPDENLELRRLKNVMRSDGVDLLILSEPSSICYASGYEMPLPIGAGADFAGGPNLLLVGADENDALIVAETEASKASMQSRADQLFVYPCYGFFSPLSARDEFRSIFRRVLTGMRPSKEGLNVAVEMRNLPLLAAHVIEQEFPHVELREASSTVNQARRIKTPREIERIRASAAANDAGQEALRTHLVSDASELDLWAAMVNSSEQSAGHPVPVVGELVSGARTAVLDYPSGPMRRTVSEGDTVICDYSVMVDGYWSDTTNTLVVGEPSAEQRRYFEAALAAFETAAAMLKPGVRALDVAEAAHSVLRERGLEPIHHMGHQIGTSAHEHPNLVCHDQEIIETGMVFCLEPGGYAGKGGSTGARVEKMFLVTDHGAEVLNHFQWGVE
jgi:Xaa-Pro aminopeptidase